MHAVLTIEFDAPPEIIKLRDELKAQVDELRRIAPDGVSIVGPDFLAYASANKISEGKLKAAEAQLVAAAKKLGLKPIGAPDILYGINGCFTGPVKMWYQITAE